MKEGTVCLPSVILSLLVRSSHTLYLSFGLSLLSLSLSLSFDIVPYSYPFHFEFGVAKHLLALLSSLSQVSLTLPRMPISLVTSHPPLTLLTLSLELQNIIGVTSFMSWHRHGACLYRSACVEDVSHFSPFFNS